MSFASSSQIGGPDDYSAVEERPDVLVYTTPELTADQEVTGPVRLELFASSSAALTGPASKAASGFSSASSVHSSTPARTPCAP